MANLMWQKSRLAFGRCLCRLPSFHPTTIILPCPRFFSADCSVTRYFTKKHEWVVVNANIGTIGISQHAQDSLGDIVFVQLPQVGSEVNVEDECGALESVKAASELYSPVSGTVVEINSNLEEKPELVNKSCYDEGWLFKLELKDPAELESLMKEQDYVKFLKTDDH